MKRIITLDNKNIEYTLKISDRSRGIRLVIQHDGNFVVTISKKVSEKVAEDFIIKKSKWIIDKITHLKNNPKIIVKKHTVQEIKEYKKQANILALLRLQYWNKFYNFEYKKISIKNVKSRWGSCSKKGNINFNYKIALLPKELADYIIVHELCHLKEMNHSAKFWKLVAKTIPHHKELRRQLKSTH